MQTMRERFDDIVADNSLRQVYAIIRKDPELSQWVNDQVPELNNLPAQVYCIINNMSPVCEHNKLRRWKDSWAGFFFCGEQACACWKENQSQKVSAAKAAMSECDWQQVLEKREKTNLQKYGTKSAMQSPQVLAKIANTNLEKYGVKSTLQVPEIQEKIKATAREKYGSEHPMQNSQVVAKAQKTNLDRYGHISYPQSQEGRKKVRKTLKERYNVASIAQLHFSQETRDILQDTQRFHQMFYDVGIQGICEKFPELSYEMCRCKLIREGIPEVYAFTKPETFVKALLDRNNINYVSKSRKIISPLELDFFIPTHNLAIEVCGLYWHRHDRLQDTNYHVNKLDICLSKGIQLLTIFSDQITYKPTIVEQRILNKLGMIKRSHHARQLKLVVDRSTKDINAFLEQTHIQGGKTGTVNIAAVDHHQNICAVMTFGKTRTSLGSKSKEGDYEMYRFATMGNIPGIASKMFKHFISISNPKSVISYSDRCWGEGDLYPKLGFIKQHITRPNYWYTKDFIQKIHRFAFAKHTLVAEGYDGNLTEFQIMASKGYSRVYDCGSVKYKWFQ